VARVEEDRLPLTAFHYHPRGALTWGDKKGTTTNSIFKIEREHALLEMNVTVHDDYHHHYTYSHGYTKRGRSHVIKTDDKKLDSGNTKGYVTTFRIGNM
jgi:hypothetical protein